MMTMSLVCGINQSLYTFMESTTEILKRRDVHLLVGIPLPPTLRVLPEALVSLGALTRALMSCSTVRTLSSS